MALDSILGETLRSKRRGTGIPAAVLARKTGISASRLSALECGHISVTRQEMCRIMSALDQLVIAKDECEKVKARFGWPAEADASFR